MLEQNTASSGVVVVRRRTVEDLDDCAAILRRVHAKDGYPVSGVTNAKGFLTHEDLERAWVAELNGKIVGHVGQGRATANNSASRIWQEQHPDVPAVILRTLFIDPGCRGYGIAEKLMLAVEDWAEENSVRLVLLNLIKDQVAKRLYERLGWTLFGEVMFRFGDGKEMTALLYVNSDRFVKEGPSPVVFTATAMS